MEQFDVVIVGSGLVGAAVAWELSRAGVRTAVLEASNEIAAGASRSNSGLLCTGFDSEPGTLETEMILEQGRRWRPVFDSLGIPYRIPGALVLAHDEAQEARLPALARNASQNGVETTLLDRAEVARREPGVRARAALLVPAEAITDPYEVVRGLLSQTPEVRLEWPVREVSSVNGGAEVAGPAGRIAARFVINCAGLYADEVAADGAFQITPRRGEFLAFGEGSAERIRHILLPVPSGRTKGVLLFPTVHGRLCAGPSAIDQVDKEDWRPRANELSRIRARAAEILPELASVKPVAAWAGLRPVGHPRNYYVGWSSRVPSMLSIAGIRSTGLSSCLGLSSLALRLLEERGLESRGRELRPLTPAAESMPVPWWERLNRLRNWSG
ncbi:MAG TPA: FAD-dependent oxidoreductase [Trueperaceae bacterium]